jgi:hypothetical protein
MKNYYNVLKVRRTSTPEEIHNSYRDLSNLNNPASIDQSKDPLGWTRANDIIKELNEAYDILKDPVKRADFDRSYFGDTSQTNNNNTSNQQNNSNTQQNNQTNSGNNSGNPFNKKKFDTVTFEILPDSVKDRLTKLGSNTRKDVLKVDGGSTFWHWAGAIAAIVLFIYNVSSTYSYAWAGPELIGKTLLNVVSFAWFGYHVFSILRFNNSPIKKGTYITKLYFIKTDVDQVTYHLLRDLADLKITHHHKNGSYQYTEIRMVFPVSDYTFTLNSQQQAQNFILWLQNATVEVNGYISSQNWSTLSSLDDFNGLSSNFQNDPALATEGKAVQKKVLQVAAIACIVVTGSMIFLNRFLDDSYAWKKACDYYGIEGYRDYIRESKAGNHKGAYIKEADDRAYENAKAANTITSIKEYYQDSVFQYHKKEAYDNIQTQYETIISNYKKTYAKNGKKEGSEIFVQYLRRAQKDLNTTVNISFTGKNQIPDNIEKTISEETEFKNILPIGSSFSEESNKRREYEILESFSSAVHEIIPDDALSFEINEKSKDSSDIFVSYSINVHSLYYMTKDEHLAEADRSYYPGVNFTWICFFRSVAKEKGEPYVLAFTSKPSSSLDIQYDIYTSMASSAFRDFKDKLSGLLLGTKQYDVEEESSEE